MKTDPSARDLPSKCSLRFHSQLLPDPVYAGVGAAPATPLLYQQSGCPLQEDVDIGVKCLFNNHLLLPSGIRRRSFVVGEPQRAVRELCRNYHTPMGGPD